MKMLIFFTLTMETVSLIQPTSDGFLKVSHDLVNIEGIYAF